MRESVSDAGENLKVYRFEHDVAVAALPGDVFRFLREPANLRKLDPEWLDVKLMHATDQGAEYVFSWLGMPLYIRMRVSGSEFPHRLELRQVLGPWRAYRQISTMEPYAKGTCILETFEFDVGTGLMEHLLNAILIRRQFGGVLRYRAQALVRELGRNHEAFR